MNVTQAINTRMSSRMFLDRPVSTSVLEQALITASRSPSGGNLQPWKIVLLNADGMTQFREIMEKRLSGEAFPGGEAPEYQVYPDKMKEPYRTARFEIGEDMYALLGISRDDKVARLKWFSQNYRFFGAPAAIFCFVDRMMGAPQWSDLGMFLQSFMLLLTEQNIQNCPQECWSRFPKTVAEFCKVDPELMLFCGMAIGYADPDHPVNQLKSKRLDPSHWLSIIE